MTLNELRYFLMLAEEKHFHRAAERCYVTQPALSTAIKKLEEELGVSLFERHRQGPELTPQGERLRPQAQKILKEVQILKEMAYEETNPEETAIRLGVIHTVAPYLIPPLMASMTQHRTAFSLLIEENTTANLIRLFLAHELDAALVALPFEEEGIEVIPLYQENFVSVVPHNHPLAQKERLSLSDLDQETLLLLSTQHCFSQQVLDAHPSLKQNKNVKMLQGNSLETLKNMVASGLGISVLPGTAEQNSVFNPLLKLIPFADPIPSRVIGLAYRRRFKPFSYLMELTTWIRSISLSQTHWITEDTTCSAQF